MDILERPVPTLCAQLVICRELSKIHSPLQAWCCDAGDLPEDCQEVTRAGSGGWTYELRRELWGKVDRGKKK